MGENRCIVCGAVIPEGRWVCPICENMTEKEDDAMPKEVNDYRKED